MVEAKVGAAERRAYTQHKRNIARKITQIERVWLVEVKSWERRERCGKLTSEIGSVRDYFIIYHYNVLEDGQGAMPSGVQSTRPFINVLCVS